MIALEEFGKLTTKDTKYTKKNKDSGIHFDRLTVRAAAAAARDLLSKSCETAVQAWRLGG